MRDLVFNTSFYSVPDVWPELDKFGFWRGPLSFCLLCHQSPLLKVLSIFQLRPSKLKVIELAEDENVLLSPQFQPTLTFSYRNRSLLFSAAGWTQSNVGMNRHTLVIEEAMYFQETLQKWKMKKSALN